MNKALVYEGLPDIEEVNPRTEVDNQLFQELAAVLERYGALNRFGVVLLHKHFSLNKGEVLLETTDRKKREQRIRPVVLSEVEGLEVIETSWRLGSNGDVVMSCFCARDPRTGQHTGMHLPRN